MFLITPFRTVSEGVFSETGLPVETVWKSERGRSMTYAPEHEKELLY